MLLESVLIKMSLKLYVKWFLYFFSKTRLKLLTFITPKSCLLTTFSRIFESRGHLEIGRYLCSYGGY